MVKNDRIKKLFSFLLFCCLLLVGTAALADYKVIDGASLFRHDEVKQMEELAEEIERDYHMNVLAVSDLDLGGRSSSEKSDHYYEMAGYADNKAAGGICLIIDMANREVNMTTDRLMMRYITDSREERIYDVGYDYLASGDYGNAMIAMLKQVQTFLKKGIQGNQYLYDPETGKISRYRSVNGMDMLIATMGGLFTSLLSALGVVTGYKKIGKYHYDLNANAKLNITNRSERFVHQYVTKRRINVDSARSGGSGHGGGRTTTHHSSSGRSYGGGHGRKF